MQRKRTGKIAGILFGALFVPTVAALFLSGCGKKETAYFLEERNEDENRQNFSGEMQTDEYDETKDTAETDREKIGLKEQKSEAAVCFVHICGAVKSPGVYELAEGSRIFEAVELAGGLLPEACGEYLNQAQKVTDGMKLYVPTKEQVENGEAEEQQAVFSAEGSSEEKDGGLVNINTADKTQLMTLPGIGESRAESILAYRKEAGGFAKIEDIMQVSGIKEGAYEKLKDKICVK